jgi:hypothetical protein
MSDESLVCGETFHILWLRIATNYTLAVECKRAASSPSMTYNGDGTFPETGIEHRVMER